jgi:hypothetical protein
MSAEVTADHLTETMHVSSQTQNISYKASRQDEKLGKSASEAQQTRSHFFSFSSSG